jgi:uncharacterized OB-fold protein
VTERPASERDEAGFGDPLSVPFWHGAARRELMVQRCRRCGARQLFARPFCLACDAADLEWVRASGLGTIYSMTTVRRQASPDFPAPYVNALVELDEGPRVLTTIVGIVDGRCAIGDRVRVTWKDRASAPPLPVFEPVPAASAR